MDSIKQNININDIFLLNKLKRLDIKYLDPKTNEDYLDKFIVVASQLNNCFNKKYPSFDICSSFFKDMRILHGKILKIYYDIVNKKITEENLYYKLSSLDSTILLTRNILNTIETNMIEYFTDSASDISDTSYTPEKYKYIDDETDNKENNDIDILENIDEEDEEDDEDLYDKDIEIMQNKASMLDDISETIDKTDNYTELKLDESSEKFLKLIETIKSDNLKNKNVLPDDTITEVSINKESIDKLTETGEESIIETSIVENGKPISKTREINVETEELEESEELETVEISTEKPKNKQNLKTKSYNVGKPTLLLFFAEWCGHCRRFAPIWNKLNIAIDKNKMNLLKIDSENPVTKDFKIAGFPTLILINNNEGITYEGPRTLEDILGFLNGTLGTNVINERTTTSSSDDIPTKSRKTKNSIDKSDNNMEELSNIFINSQ